MAYRIIFEDVKKTIHEIAILDSVPNVGDDIVMTYFDPELKCIGEAAFPVKHRTFAYKKYFSPPGGQSLGNSIHLDKVHVLLGEPIHPIVFETPED